MSARAKGPTDRPVSRSATRRPDRAQDRRVAAVAAIASLALHGAALSMRFDSGLGDDAAARSARAPATGSAMRVHDLVIVDETPPAAPVERAVPQDPQPQAAAPADAGPVTTPVAIPVTPDPGSLSSRLAPRLTDSRLWPAPTAPASPEAVEADRIRSPVREGVAAINDSIAGATEAERRASDWTAADEDGGRWGISPDRIHLGGRTLLLRSCSVEPCPGWLIPTPPERRDEYANRLRGFAEIGQQARRAATDSILAERMRAIRARDRVRRDSIGSGGAGQTE